MKDHDIVGYNTHCWWCGASVYFHRDDNGGCVLFDALGPPWPIHGCWLEHREESQTWTKRAKSELDALGYDGRFFPVKRERSTDFSEMDIAKGYGVVIDNHALLNEPDTREFGLAPGRTIGYPLSPVDIAFDERTFCRFFVPTEIAKQLDDYAIVYARGIWKLCQEAYWLFAASIKVYGNPGVGAPATFTWKARAPFDVCWYCNSSLVAQSDWDFDEQGHPECGPCALMRGGMSPRAFLRHCRRIAANHRRRPRGDGEECP